MFYFVHSVSTSWSGHELYNSTRYLFTSEKEKQTVEGHRLELGILTSQDEIIAVYLKGNDVLFCSLHLQVGRIMSYIFQPGIYSPVKTKTQIVEGHRMLLGILTSQDEIIAEYLKGNDVLFCSLHLQVGQIKNYTIQPSIYSPVKKKKQIGEGHRLELGILTNQHETIIAVFLKGNDVLFCSLRLQVDRFMSYIFQPGIYSPVKYKTQIVEGHRMLLGILTSQDEIIAEYLKGNDVLFCSLRLQVGWIMNYIIQPGIFSSVKKKINTCS